MTKPKTSVEKLESLEAKVSDGSSALVATRWKWREIRMKVRELFDLIDHSCGFCSLATLRKGEKAGRCDPCQVSSKCTEIQVTASALGAGLDEMIDDLFEYLSVLKVEEIAD